jgi:hypothetical protein
MAAENSTAPRDEAKYDATLTDWRDTGRLLRLIAINTYVAYSNSLVGNPAPAVRAVYERKRNPQPGDIVMETSTIWRWAEHADEAPSDQYPAIGVLLRIESEPVCTQTALDEMHADGDYFVRLDEKLTDVPTERVFYIKPLDGSVPEYRWTNADFIRVSDSLRDARPTVREEGGVSNG